jgi:DNA-binding NarL/FixJ family response regulator
VTTVVLVDDQGLVRAGFQALLNSEDEIEVVGQAADGQAGLELVRRLRPDVVLMDIRMPVLDGLAATAEITSDPGLADTRVIVLTTFELDEYVFGALRAGASGSPLTAKTHVARLFAKLEARDRAQLVVIAYESGIVVAGSTDRAERARSDTPTASS